MKGLDKQYELLKKRSNAMYYLTKMRWLFFLLGMLTAIGLVGGIVLIVWLIGMLEMSKMKSKLRGD